VIERNGTAVVIVFDPVILPWLKALAENNTPKKATNIKRTNLIIILLKLSVANIRIETDATIILK
jgi:hypothetical protein